MTGAVGSRASADGRFMRRALRLAERGWGRVAPDPLVGAVAVRDGEVVGEGWHREFGGPHAETEALEAAGARARGATVHVSLEPCTHHGKTAPCADALIGAGVRRVVVGCRDPHAEAGGGVERLREAGVEVTVGVEGLEAARLNAPFLWRHAGGGPFVALKLALSLDGRIARSPGSRTAVTGDEAWSYVHRQRAGHRAVLVGRRTAEVDDPRLTARGEVRPRRPRVRAVLDTRLRLPPDSTLARTAGEGSPVWVLCAPGPHDGRRAPLEEAGVRVLEVEASEDARGVDPAATVARLASEGVRTVLVEGGGRVAASFLAADRVHRMHLLYAPVAFGPRGVEGFPGLTLGEGAWSPAERRELGRDTLLVLESRPLRRVLRGQSREEAACSPG